MFINGNVHRLDSGLNIEFEMIMFEIGNSEREDYVLIWRCISLLQIFIFRWNCSTVAKNERIMVAIGNLIGHDQCMKSIFSE